MEILNAYQITYQVPDTLISLWRLSDQNSLCQYITIQLLFY